MSESPRQVLGATRVRQGRFGRHVVWVLLFGTLLAALALFGAWTWKAGDLSRAPANNPGPSSVSTGPSNNPGVPASAPAPFNAPEPAAVVPSPAQQAASAQTPPANRGTNAPQ